MSERMHLFYLRRIIMQLIFEIDKDGGTIFGFYCYPKPPYHNLHLDKSFFLLKDGNHLSFHDWFVEENELKDRLYNSYRFAVAILRKYYPQATKIKRPCGSGRCSYFLIKDNNASN